jgi:hypothetical protein
MRNLTWRNLTKAHFYLLLFLLIQLSVDVLTSYRLNQQIISGLIIVLYASGLILFFHTLKPFKLALIYYSVYALTVLSLILVFTIGGLFVAITASVLLYPVYPKAVKYENADIKLYARSQGFLSMCCSYEVVRPQNMLVEKYVGYINLYGSKPGPTALFRWGNEDTLFYQPRPGASPIVLPIR